MKAKLIGPVIVVFPDGLQESYCTDSKDGKKPSETRVPLDYVETTCPHDCGCALGAQGAKSWTFLEAAFERTLTHARMHAMSSWQPGILTPPTAAGRFMTLGLTTDARPREVAARLAALPIDGWLIAGVGAPLARALGRTVEGLHDFREVHGPGGTFPSTQGALWFFVGGTDSGEILHRARRVVDALGDYVRIDEDIPSFVYGGGRDLSGYEDGTENPKGEHAVDVTFGPAGPTRTGGCFVATQKWIHALGGFERLSRDARNDIFGRDVDSNEELAAAPLSAHVKRAAQESYDPPAFMLRRSMPWGDVREHGLYFVAYAASLEPFEHVLRRMAGLEDGTVDALLKMSRAVTGGAFWCPPVVKLGAEMHLDLSALGF